MCSSDLLMITWVVHEVIFLRITAVQAVTCSHPNIVERAASGNGSGRCVLWAPADA